MKTPVIISGRNVIKFVKVMNESSAIGIIEKKFPLFNAAIKDVVKLHNKQVYMIEIRSQSLLSTPLATQDAEISI